MKVLTQDVACSVPNMIPPEVIKINVKIIGSTLNMFLLIQ